jgi:hypothetical protein
MPARRRTSLSNGVSAWLVARVRCGAYASRLVVAGGALASFCAPLAHANSDEPRAAVAVELPARPVFVEETFRIVFRIDVDEALTTPDWPQLFTDRLDAPVQLDAPWLDAPPFGRALANRGAPPAQPCTFALEHGPTVGERVGWVEREGRRALELTYARTFVAEHAGRFALLGPRLRFATATQLERDVFGAPVAVDTRFVAVEGRAVELEVRALPEEGRPASFGGAIGSFTLTADAAPRELAVNEELALTVSIRGAGNLATFAAPRLGDASDWHVLGVLDEPTDGARTLRYSLRPKSSAPTRAPRVEFAYFDPDASAYRTLAAPELAIRVTPPASERASDGPSDPPRPRSRVIWSSGIIIAIVLLAIGRRRRRQRALERPERAREALARFERELAQPAADVERAWTAFLADELGLAPSAVSTHDVAERLRDAGATAELAAGAERALHAEVGARFGGSAPERELQDLVELARSLDRALAAAPRRA